LLLFSLAVHNKLHSHVRYQIQDYQLGLSTGLMMALGVSYDQQKLFIAVLSSLVQRSILNIILTSTWTAFDYRISDVLRTAIPEITA
jgi:hypothetical protein